MKAVGVFVEPTTGDDRAVLPDDAHGTIDRHHLAGRLDERPLKRSSAPNRTDVAQIRADDGAGSPHPMTPGAGPLAGEDRSPTRDIARLHRRGVERIHVAQV